MGQRGSRGSVSCCVCREDTGQLQGSCAEPSPRLADARSKADAQNQDDYQHTDRKDGNCCGSRFQAPLPGDSPRREKTRQRRGAGGPRPRGDDGFEDPSYVSCLGGSMGLTPRSGRHCGSLDRADEGGREPEAPQMMAPAPRYEGLCAIACSGGDRPRRHHFGGAASRESLLGDKSLRAKQLEIGALEKKLEALMQTRTQVATRVEAADGAEIAVPSALDAGAGALCLKEWVDQIMRHEESMAGVQARTVKQACGTVLGTTNRLIELGEVKEHYADILSAVDNLAQHRISAVSTELTKLDCEVGEIEDLIWSCYEKMVDEDESAITRERFVMFVCGTCDGEESVELGVRPKDAESVFLQMSKGKNELSFEQLKIEVPHGCLQVMRGHIEDARNQEKRYRDYWF